MKKIKFSIYALLVVLISGSAMIGCSKTDDADSNNLNTSETTPEATAKKDVSLNTNIDEVNKTFEEFKARLNVTADGVIIASDDEKPKYLSKYLSQLNKKESDMKVFNHISLDTKTSNGILDIYTIQYSNDITKYLFIVESSNDLYFSNIYDVQLEITKDNNLALISHNDYIMSNGEGDDKNPKPTPSSGWSQCFGDCMTAGLDYHNLLGQVILVGGGTAWMCPPCGAVASLYVTTLAVACGGGCIH